MNVQKCYRFCPKDRELIDILVYMKRERKSIPPFLEKTLYGDQLPWEILKQDDPSWEYTTDEGEHVISKTVFVFTPLLVKGKNKVLRTAGSSMWDGKAVNNKIKNRQGQLIGNKKAFTFRMDKANKKEKNQEQQFEENSKGRWIMHEYTTSLVQGDYALCKITVDKLPNNLDVGCSTSPGSEYVATRKRKASSLVPDLEIEEQEIFDRFPNYLYVGCSTSKRADCGAARTWKYLGENQEIIEIEDCDLNNLDFDFLEEMLTPGFDNETILSNTYPSRVDVLDEESGQQRSEVLNEEEIMDDASFVRMLDNYLES